ncbi:MAG: hypothetical protein M5U28_16410 [Sandaracinaceae bacterium]|nr:hypothetical protein [Sandaracinaceae bacterium]
MVGGALALSVATGLLSGLGGRYLTQLWQSDAMIDQVLSVFVTSALVVLVLASVVVGLGRTLRTVVPVLAATLAVAWIVTVLSGLGTGHMALAALAWVMAVAVVVILALAARALAGASARSRSCSSRSAARCRARFSAAAWRPPSWPSAP